MADGGGGKIRAKKSLKSRKPYSRPQNQSILSRISYSVKSLFDPITPQWLSKKSEGTPVDDKDSHHSQLEKLPAQETTLSVAQKVAGTSSTFNSVPGSDPSATGSHSQSDVSIATTTNTPHKRGDSGNSALFQLWSSKPSSSQQQATLTDEKQPQFIPSLLLSPHKRNAFKDANESSFYTGKVQYGGALNVSRTVNYTSPYSIPRATKVQVRSAYESRLTDPQNASTKSISSSNNMSSTARKILQTLEKMSTPLNDAKKIPTTYYQSPSYLAARRRSVAGSLLSRKTTGNKVPPVQSRARIHPVPVHKSAKIPLDNSLSTHQVLKAATSVAGEPPVTEITDTPKMAKPDHFHDAVEPSSIFSSVAPPSSGKMKSRKRAGHYSAPREESPEPELPDLPSIALPLSKSMPSFNFGQPAKTSTPAVSKPRPVKEKSDYAVTSSYPRAISSPSFDFATPSAKTSQASTAPATTTAASPEYEFRPPVESVCEKKTNESSKKVTFNFPSTPTNSSAKRNVMPKKSEESPATKSLPLKATGSVMDILGEKSRGTKVEEEKSNVSLAKSSDTDQADPSPLSKIFKSQSEKWECHVCLVKNNRDADKCVACAAPCPGQTKPPLSTLFQAKSNKWECEVCMVRNDQSQAACVACATPKPGAQPVKKADEKSSSSANFNFKTSLNSSEAGGQDTKSTPVFTQLIKPRTKKWECPCCMVQNDEAKDKCACCETKKPNDASKNDIFSSSHSQTVSQSMSTPAETFSSALLKQSKSSKRECKSCMLFNDISRTACGDLKPGTVSDKNEQPTTNFKFGMGSGSTTAPWTFGTDSSKESGKAEEKPQTTTTASISFGTGPITGTPFSFGISSAKPVQSDKAGVENTNVQSASSGNVTATSAETFDAKSSSVAPVLKTFQTRDEGKWECDICLVRNNSSLSKCAACQNPKPGLSSAENPSQATAFKFGSTSAPLFKFGLPEGQSDSGKPAVQAEQSSAAKSLFGEAPSLASSELPKITGTNFRFGATAVAPSFGSASGGTDTSYLPPLDGSKLAAGNTKFSFKAAPDSQSKESDASANKPGEQTTQDSTISTSFTSSTPILGSFLTNTKSAASLFGKNSVAEKKVDNSLKTAGSGFTGFKFGNTSDSKPNELSEPAAKQPAPATSFSCPSGQTTFSSAKPNLFGSNQLEKRKLDVAQESSKEPQKKLFGAETQVASTPKPTAFQFGAAPMSDSTASSSFSFGKPAAQTGSAPAPLFGAGTHGSSSGPGNLGFGAAQTNEASKATLPGVPELPGSSQKVPAFSFALNPKPDTSSLPNPFAFGAPKQQDSFNAGSTGFSFGQSANAGVSSANFKFGASAQATAPTFQASSGFSFGAGSATAASDKPAGFNFGAPASSGFKFSGSSNVAPGAFNAGPSTSNIPSDAGSMFNIGAGNPGQGSRASTPQHNRQTKRAVRRLKK